MPIQKLHLEFDIFVTGERDNMTPGELFELVQRIIEDHGMLVDSGCAKNIGPQVIRKSA